MSHFLTSKTSKSLFFVGTAVAALSLNACASVVGDPNFLPTGYAHHGKVYKSKTPPPSQRVSNEQRADMGPVQAEQFRSATYDILSRLTSRAGLPPKAAYIDAASPMTPFYANIDNDLREAMRAQGYRLADTAEGSYIFQYNAELMPGYRSYDLESAVAGAPNIELTLDVMTDVHGTLKVLTHEVGNYYIQGAEDLLIAAPHIKSLPLENSMRYLNEAGMYEPRTENTYHSRDQLGTVQPVMDKTKTPIMAAPMMKAPTPIAPSYVQPAMEPMMVSPAEPQEYVVTMPSEPSEPMNGDAVQIFDPTTSEMTGSYDYSASINDMSNTAPVRRGPRVSKQVEY